MRALFGGLGMVARRCAAVARAECQAVIVNVNSWEDCLVHDQCLTPSLRSRRRAAAADQHVPDARVNSLAPPPMRVARPPHLHQSSSSMRCHWANHETRRLSAAPGRTTRELLQVAKPASIADIALPPPGSEDPAIRRVRSRAATPPSVYQQTVGVGRRRRRRRDGSTNQRRAVVAKLTAGRRRPCEAQASGCTGPPASGLSAKTQVWPQNEASAPDRHRQKQKSAQNSRALHPAPSRRPASRMARAYLRKRRG